MRRLACRAARILALVTNKWPAYPPIPGCGQHVNMFVVRTARSHQIAGSPNWEGIAKIAGACACLASGRLVGTLYHLYALGRR
eukprot:scaffold20944_cov106-Isochrysis_galbana.AAC.6